MKYVLKVAYDGGSFAGFQRQPKEVTVQGQLERALSKLFAQPIELNGAGRTDTGVHGIGQVVAFDSEVDRPLKGVVDGTNGMLGESVAITEGALLPSDSEFHPRFSARSRTYRYLVLASCERGGPTLWDKRSWCVAGAPDKSRLDNACSVFLGEHDFTTFTARCDMPNFCRTVQEFHVQRLPQQLLPGELWQFTIKANAFLRKMVRLLVAGVLECGLGLLDIEHLEDKLSAKNSDRAPHPAPPSGLYFESVEYENDPFSLDGLAKQHYSARPLPGLRFKGV